MAEDEGNSGITPDERPLTARKDARKVPGGFGVEDLDDLSPTKADFTDSANEDHEASNIEAIAHNNQVPSLDHATLPSLPPPSNSSLLYPNSENGDHMDSLDEGEMQRHLNDVESSFLPALSPIVTGKSGVDDTYLFDSAQAEKVASNPIAVGTTPQKEDTTSEGISSPPTPENAYQTPGPPRAGTPENDTSEDAGNTTASLETMSSSPTAAAAARTISRAISHASFGGYDTANDATGEDSELEADPEATPKKPKKTSRLTDADSSDGQSTLRHHLSSLSLVDAGSTPGHALLERRSSRKLPKFLRSRHGSHRSSNSSFHANDDQDESDTNYGADYALQSGGALPANGISRTSSVGLQRSISLGSMASGIEDFGNDSRIKDTGLATLTEDELSRGRRDEGPRTPETPRATSRSLAAAPTDTIIARHVRNVQVPESLAKEYRSKSGVSSPKRNGFATSTVGRNGKNLTLKEQSSTIERLSKENFDLKLKVMFLSDRLDKLSEEGVREMISENVELKTGLAIMQRDNKALRRKVKELEKQMKENEGRPDTARSGTSTDESPKWFDQEGAQEREEELLYLRERVEEYVTEIEKLRNEGIARENEKRNLAEVVRSMGERRGHNLDAREEMDVWKDLLEQETARREQGDEDIKKLREEVFRLKSEASSTGIPGLNHTTNIYNITKKRTISPSRESRPPSELSHRTDDRNGAFSAASTLVEELKKETEQLRHENAELRREVGAQTSMLTSRNREKERLYQEIEDLKLGQRRVGGGGSIAGDSILERSASRAGGHVRSSSRVSAVTRQTGFTDVEREDYENKNAELRDKINSLKLQSQELQRELDSCMEDFETAAEQKKDAEVLVTELQEALEVAENDLLTMQADRDEALQGQDEAEHMFEALRKEAQEELDGFAAEVDDANNEIERMQSELTDTQENFTALQNEMQQMSEALVRLEDDQETHLKRIQELEKELDEANKELEQMETNLVEANSKINRLTVQQESSQGEIAFLREEQDGDKIKIGDLEAAIRNTEQNLQEERDRGKELEQRIADERYQREVVASQEKTEVQQFVNELNREASNAKDDARKLRRILTSKEVEAAEWKERLMELESNLREALGDLGGTRSSFLKSIAKLQRELENTVRDFDSTKASLAEKERLIKQRDALLESHGLESRKLSDMIEKERQLHRTTKHQFETYQKTQQHTTRTLSQQESRVLELETSRQQDRRKIASLEATFKDQLTERNNLLLAMWNRLSALCGSDWTHNNSLISGRALPSLEAVSTMLPGFSKNLFAAVKHLESIVIGFKAQIRTVERDLWKEYQNLEYNLDVRSKRIDRLETMTKSGIPIITDGKAEMAKLRDANKSLKAEISSLRAAYEVRSRAYEETGSPSPSVPTGPRSSSSSRSKIPSSRTSTMTRHHSNNAVETIERLTTATIPDDDYKPDLRWQVRLQELEYKLKAEREARKLDRSSARQRLEEKSRENAELAAEVERGRVREDLRS